MRIRSHSGDALSKIPEAHGKLLVTRNGVYLVHGDSKLRNLELISWEQLLGSVGSGMPEATIPGPARSEI